MRTVAIPFIREGYLNFWKIVKMDDALYSKAIWENHSIIRIDGRTKEQVESLLKSERTRLLKQRWEVSKAKAFCRYIEVKGKYATTTMEQLKQKINGANIIKVATMEQLRDVVVL